MALLQHMMQDKDEKIAEYTSTIQGLKHKSQELQGQVFPHFAIILIGSLLKLMKKLLAGKHRKLKLLQLQPHLQLFQLQLQLQCQLQFQFKLQFQLQLQLQLQPQSQQVPYNHRQYQVVFLPHYAS